MKLYIKILTIISLFIFVTSCSDKPLTLGDIGEAAAESFEMSPEYLMKKGQKIICQASL